MLAHLANLTHDADAALVFGMVLGPVKGAFLIRGAAVNGRVAGCADVELGKLVELDLNRVIRVPLALSLSSASL